MENKKLVPTWMTIVLLALSVATIVIDIIVFKPVSEISIAGIFALILDMLTALSAILYCIFGYKKKGALFFKIYSILFMVGKIFALPIALMGVNIPVIVIILMVLECVIAVILAFGKNPGKILSYILVGAIIIISILDIFVGPKDIIAGIWGKIGCVVLAVIYGLMIFGKYQDKAARGTK